MQTPDTPDVPGKPDKRPRGRPPSTVPLAKQRKTRAIRLDDARWAQFKLLGTGWLEQQLDAQASATTGQSATP